MASSITMPVASDSASIVMLFSVKPSIFMNVNVPMIDIGTASAEMTVARTVADEEEDDQAGQEAPQDQVLLDVLERLPDERGLVAADRRS